MLSKILSVTGRPGLYKLVSTNKNMNIVESLSDGKRIPVYVHEKVIALSDISIYTESGDTPLREVFKAIKEKEGAIRYRSDQSHRENDCSRIFPRYYRIITERACTRAM